MKNEHLTAPLLQARGLNISFLLNGKPLPVLENISLEVGEGEAVALVGPSGCGKSTLLALLAGFFPPDGGEISRRGRQCLMLQRDLLLPHRSVLDNVLMPVTARAPQRLAAERERVRELLPRFGLAGFAASWPHQLSGGMRQRAALLRTVVDSDLAVALGQGPVCWLLDEPFAKLDVLTKEELQPWLDRLRRERQAAAVLVTHDISEAQLLCDRIYVLSPRPGRIQGCLAVDRENAAAQKEQIKALLRGE